MAGEEGGVWVIPSSPQGLFLALNLGITPEELRKPYGMLGIEHGWTTCKGNANPLFYYFGLFIVFFFLEGEVFGATSSSTQFIPNSVLIDHYWQNLEYLPSD